MVIFIHVYPDTGCIYLPDNTGMLPSDSYGSPPKALAKVLEPPFELYLSPLLKLTGETSLSEYYIYGFYYIYE